MINLLDLLDIVLIRFNLLIIIDPSTPTSACDHLNLLYAFFYVVGSRPEDLTWRFPPYVVPIVPVTSPTNRSSFQPLHLFLNYDQEGQAPMIGHFTWNIQKTFSWTRMSKWASWILRLRTVLWSGRKTSFLMLRSSCQLCPDLVK